jgi:hypothetical protein
MSVAKQGNRVSIHFLWASATQHRRRPRSMSSLAVLLAGRSP